MPEHHEQIVLKLDTTSFVEVMRRAVANLERLADSLGLLGGSLTRAQRAHQARHHRRETPAATALHTAYDHRRRARRRRNR